MTEVPEHLLQRSRDRRAALGLGGGDGGGGDAAPATSGASSNEALEPAGVSASAQPAAVAPVEVEAKPPPPPPPYVEAALKRKRIPYWAMPVLAFLPVWAILYAGSLSPASTGELTPLAEGAEIYAARCASCHGGGGGGGVGRPLADGEVVKTFPDIGSQIEFVSLGSAGYPTGQGYGDPNREGGQRSVGSFGQMPAFGESLTHEELLAVVRHERETLSGEEGGFEVDAEGHRLDADGNPLISEEGELVGPDGSPLLDETGRLVIQVAGTAGGSVGGQPGDLDAQP